jgi:hypothetical protein
MYVLTFLILQVSTISLSHAIDMCEKACEMPHSNECKECLKPMEPVRKKRVPTKRDELKKERKETHRLNNGNVNQLGNRTW